jgi:hypothetical protein
MARDDHPRIQCHLRILATDIHTHTPQREREREREKPHSSQHTADTVQIQDIQYLNAGMTHAHTCMCSNMTVQTPRKCALAESEAGQSD